uniref:Reverse transcriptase domain-containing protein n=1 Tax=Tanacetum cinerariifolium TaxID=118510 RepID=A0A699GTU0_TANCI|nr:hypothetical protein [Tanacetum cinerariifolium]
MNQQRQQEALLVAQREQELVDQKEAARKRKNHHKTLTLINLLEKYVAQKFNFRVIHKMSSISNTSQIYSVIAIAPDLPTEEPEYSLSMGDEHLSTISETKSDKVIKSSVENLVPIPSESEVTFDNKSECDVPVNDESSPNFTTFSNTLFDCNDDFTSSDDESLSNEDVPMENFKIYSNPFIDDEESISPKIDLHHVNAKSDLIESLLNHDSLIDSSPKFDFLLEEFSGELAHINSIPLGIEEADFDLEEEIHLVENLLYDNSSPRPPKELNAKIADTIVKSLTPSPIPVEDSDSQMEEIDLFLDTDDLMPPGIEKPDTGVLAAKIMEDISEHYVLMPKVLSTQIALCPNIDHLLTFSSENEDKVFKLGILSYLLVSHRDKTISDFFEDPMMISGGDIPLLDVPYLHFYLP